MPFFGIGMKTDFFLVSWGKPALLWTFPLALLLQCPVKVLHSIRQQIWKTQQWPQDWKRSVFTPTSKKGNAKECSNYHTVALISHASQVMLKILQARLQHYVNWEFPDIKARFRKGRRTRDQIANTRKTSTSASLTMPKSLCGAQQTVENSSRDGNTRSADLPPEKSVCRSRSNS